MAGSTTLILGGGVGGIVTANTLRTLLPKEHRIALVSKTPSMHLGATQTWVMMGERQPRQVTRSFDALKRRGIDLYDSEVRRINAETREVVTENATLKRDFLVVALGADLNLGAIDGLDRAAESFYTMEGALKLREQLKAWKGGDLVFLNPRMPIKCPPAPYEAAMLIEHDLKRRGLRDQTRMSFYTIEPAPIPTAGPTMGTFVRGALAERNIALHTQKQLKSVDATRKLLTFADGSEVKYDLLIAVPPHEAPRVARDSGLARGGWIPVDPRTMKTSAPQVFALGDVTAVPLPGRYKPEAPLMLPKAAVFAEAQGRIVAGQIAAQVLGKEPKELFEGNGFCYLELGDHHAMVGEGNFYATPQPSITMQLPGMAAHDAKRKWVDDWMRANL